MGKVPRKINVPFPFAYLRVLQRLTAAKRGKRTKCYSLSLCGGIYAAQTEQGFAKNEICLFQFARPRKLQRLTAAKRRKRTKCYSLSLRGGIYAAQTGQGFAKNEICLFPLLVRENAAVFCNTVIRCQSLSLTLQETLRTFFCIACKNPNSRQNRIPTPQQ